MNCLLIFCFALVLASAPPKMTGVLTDLREYVSAEDQKDDMIFTLSTYFQFDSLSVSCPAVLPFWMDQMFGKFLSSAPSLRVPALISHPKELYKDGQLNKNVVQRLLARHDSYVTAWRKLVPSLSGKPALVKRVDGLLGLHRQLLNAWGKNPMVPLDSTAFPFHRALKLALSTDKLEEQKQIFGIVLQRQLPTSLAVMKIILEDGKLRDENRMAWIKIQQAARIQAKLQKEPALACFDPKLEQVCALLDVSPLERVGFIFGELGFDQAHIGVAWHACPTEDERDSLLSLLAVSLVASRSMVQMLVENDLTNPCHFIASLEEILVAILEVGCARVKEGIWHTVQQKMAFGGEVSKARCSTLKIYCGLLASGLNQLYQENPSLAKPIHYLLETAQMMLAFVMDKLSVYKRTMNPEPFHQYTALTKSYAHFLATQQSQYPEVFSSFDLTLDHLKSGLKGLEGFYTETVILDSSSRLFWDFIQTAKPKGDLGLDQVPNEYRSSEISSEEDSTEETPSKPKTIWDDVQRVSQAITTWKVTPVHVGVLPVRHPPAHFTLDCPVGDVRDLMMAYLLIGERIKRRVINQILKQWPSLKDILQLSVEEFTSSLQDLVSPIEYNELSVLMKYYDKRNTIAHPQGQEKKACLSHITVLSENAQLTLTMARKIKTQLAIKDKSRYTTTIQYEDRPACFIDESKTECSLSIIGLYEACQIDELKNYRNSAAHPRCTSSVLKSYLDYFFKDSEDYELLCRRLL